MCAALPRDAHLQRCIITKDDYDDNDDNLEEQDDDPSFLFDEYVDEDGEEQDDIYDVGEK